MEETFAYEGREERGKKEKNITQFPGFELLPKIFKSNLKLSITFDELVPLRVGRLDAKLFPSTTEGLNMLKWLYFKCPKIQNE